MTVHVLRLPITGMPTGLKKGMPGGLENKVDALISVHLYITVPLARLIITLGLAK